MTCGQAAMAAADPELGYEGFGGLASLRSALEAWVPGALVDHPPGIGRSIPAGADLLVQMHYGPSAISSPTRRKSTSFSPRSPSSAKSPRPSWARRHLDTPFILPPDQVSSFHGTLPVAADVSLINIAPHCHLIGSSRLVYATSPNNQDTIPLISIPEWDFNWQGFFTFPHLTKIPQGYTLHGEATYDNTAANPFNPNDPPQWVGFGEGTEDEMFFVFLRLRPL